jgi:hypothetical protein
MQKLGINIYIFNIEINFLFKKLFYVFFRRTILLKKTNLTANWIAFVIGNHLV